MDISLNADQTKTLHAIAEGTAASQYVMAKPKTPTFAQLESRGLVEHNDQMADDNGKVPFRLTPNGQAFINATTETKTQEGKNMEHQNAANATANATSTDAPKFALAKVEMPTISRAGGGRSHYPFEQLKTDGTGPNAFFIATGDKKNPSKSYGSIVSNQNKHAGFKKFTLRTIADGAPFGQPGVKGVAVFILAANAAEAKNAPGAEGEGGNEE